MKIKELTVAYLLGPLCGRCYDADFVFSSFGRLLCWAPSMAIKKNNA